MSLLSYTIKRLLQTLPVAIGASILVFLLMHLAPGGPVRLLLGPDADPQSIENIRRSLGLNRPIYVQYIDWITGVLQGDLGRSLSVQGGEPVMSLILSRAPVTIELAVLSLLVSLLIAIPTGIISAVRQDQPADHFARIVSLAGISIPDFWLGIMLIIVFAVGLGFNWGTGGWVPPSESIPENLLRLSLPMVTLGTAYAALIARMTRSEMVDALGNEYIQTAKAMGINSRDIVLKDATRNALIPVVTIIGVGIARLLNGSLVVELVFNLPGLGNLMLMAITRRDYNVVRALILLISLIFIYVNLVVDIVYAYLDPRISY